MVSDDVELPYSRLLIKGNGRFNVDIWPIIHLLWLLVLLGAALIVDKITKWWDNVGDWQVSWAYRAMQILWVILEDLLVLSLFALCSTFKWKVVWNSNVWIIPLIAAFLFLVDFMYPVAFPVPVLLLFLLGCMLIRFKPCNSFPKICSIHALLSPLMLFALADLALFNIMGVALNFSLLTFAANHLEWLREEVIPKITATHYTIAFIGLCALHVPPFLINRYYRRHYSYYCDVNTHDNLRGGLKHMGPTHIIQCTKCSRRSALLWHYWSSFVFTTFGSTVLITILMGWTEISDPIKHPVMNNLRPNIHRRLLQDFLKSFSETKVAYNITGATNRLKLENTKTSSEPLPNIVLLWMEAVRRDAVTPYNPVHTITPFLDKLSKLPSTVLVNDAYASIPDTVKQHLAIFCGLTPDAEFGFLSFEAVPPSYCLSRALRDIGYKTSYLMSSSLHSFAKRMEFDYVWGDESPNPTNCLSDSEVIEPAVKAFEGTKKPVFLAIKSCNSHGPYQVYGPKLEYEYAKTRSVGDTPKFNQYLNTVRIGDQVIEKLFQRLSENGINSSNTLFILTADHGEEFGENSNMYSHGASVYQEAVHVPMILVYDQIKKWPKLKSSLYKDESGRQFLPGLRTHIDIVPTIIDLIGAKINSKSTLHRGRSLLSADSHECVPLYSMHAPDAVFGRICNSMKATNDDMHGSRLFNITTDDAEDHDLSHTSPEYKELTKSMLQKSDDERKWSVALWKSVLQNI